MQPGLVCGKRCRRQQRDKGVQRRSDNWGHEKNADPTLYQRHKGQQTYKQLSQRKKETYGIARFGWWRDDEGTSQQTGKKEPKGWKNPLADLAELELADEEDAGTSPNEKPNKKKAKRPAKKPKK